MNILLVRITIGGRCCEALFDLYGNVQAKERESRAILDKYLKIIFYQSCFQAGLRFGYFSSGSCAKLPTIVKVEKLFTFEQEDSQ
mgnify:CR=1 FL=1